MEISLRRQKEWVHVVVEGRLDNFTYEHLTERLQTIHQMGFQKICLDAAGVTYMNIGTIRFLTSLAKRVRKAGGQFAVQTQDLESVKDLTLFGEKYIKFVQSSEELSA